MDFVDGALVRRNVGTPRHGTLQAIVASYFRGVRLPAVTAVTEVRLLADRATKRHRIPDVMVLATPVEAGNVITEVPLVIVEILSPDDTLNDMVDRCLDYENLGVGVILILDQIGRESCRE